MAEWRWSAAVVEALDAFAVQHGKIIPGFGHRFHPTDPRSPRLLSLVDAAREKGVIAGRFADIGRAVERAAAPQGAEDPDEHRWRDGRDLRRTRFRATTAAGGCSSSRARSDPRSRGSNLNKADASKGPCRQALPTHIPVSPSEPTMNPQHPSWKLSNQSDFQESAMRNTRLNSAWDMWSRQHCYLRDRCYQLALRPIPRSRSRSSCRSRQEVARIS